MNPYAINLPALLQPTLPTGRQPDMKLKDLEQEISFSESDIYRFLSPIGGNFDPVVRVKGLKIYQEMTEDDQVKTCLEIRKHARLSTPWNVVSSKEGDSEADMYAEFITHCLERMRGTFEDDLYQIYSAIEFGFSISEKVFVLLPDGPFKGKIGLARIKNREPYYYDFKIDPHGNMEGITYIGPTAGGYNYPININYPVNRVNGMTPTGDGTIMNPYAPEKFIIYSYNMKFGNWYGTSDLLAAFRSWIYKKHIMKFWGIWLERYASPFILATYKRDAGVKPGALAAFDDFLKNMSAKNGIRASDAWTITPVQFNSQTGQVYSEAIADHNKYISHALLVPSLLGFSTDAARGSYSLGQKQFDSFLWVLDKLGRDTEELIVGEQIIKPLIELNFPNADQRLFPKFQFEAVDEMSIQARTNIVTMLAAGGFIAPEEEWVREFLTLPNKDKDVILPNMNVMAPTGGDPNKPTQPQDKVPQTERKPIGEGGKNITEPKEPDEQKPPEEPGKMSEIKPDETHLEEQKEEGGKQILKFIKNEMRVPTLFEEKMKPTVLRDNLDAAQTILAAAASIEIEKIKDSLVKLIKKKGIISNGNPREVNKIVINPSGLKNVFRKWLFKIYLDSKLHALMELQRAGVPIEIKKKFSEIENSETVHFQEVVPFENWEPVQPSEAVDFFNKKVNAKITTDQGEKILLELASGSEIPFFDQKAFAISGVVRDDILNDAKNIILNGIKRQDENGAIEDLRGLFNKYIQQGVAIDDALLQPHRLQSIVRTNISEAVNQGRVAMYTDPDIGDFVPYFQYTAIVDDRTTDYCLCMDQKTFGPERLSELAPPAHFNCRSFTVPITSIEVGKMTDNGDGVNLDEPCPGRMLGFESVVEPTIKTILPTEAVEPSLDLPTLEQPVISGSPTNDAEILKRQLEMIVVRCPYKACRSSEIEFMKANYNVGEYECHNCDMPFRISNAGDIYLYESGLDKWQRISDGRQPNFFWDRTEAVKMMPLDLSIEMPSQEGGATSSSSEWTEQKLRKQLEDFVVRCPYKACHSDDISMNDIKRNVGNFNCNTCSLPFKVSTAGDIYLYDAGTEDWGRITLGNRPNYFKENKKGGDTNA